MQLRLKYVCDAAQNSCMIIQCSARYGATREIDLLSSRKIRVPPPDVALAEAIAFCLWSEVWQAKPPEVEVRQFCSGTPDLRKLYTPPKILTLTK